MSRKLSSAATGSVPSTSGATIPRTISKKVGQLPSAQYLAAVNVLSEATMSQACNLLLSERDYETSSTDNNNKGKDSSSKSDYEQLLELYAKCRDAAAVVHIEAPAPAPAPAPSMMPSMPSLSGSRPAGVKSKSNVTAGAKVVPGKTLGMMTSKSGIIKDRGVVPAKGSLTAGLNNPMGRRGSLKGAPRVGLPVANVKRGMLQRSESEDSAAAKKQRTNSNLNSSASNLVSDEATAPPPSALSFLKKLNQDKNADGDNSNAAPPAQERVERSTSSSSTASSSSATGEGNGNGGRGNNKSPPTTSSPSQREGVRKNPARGARHS